nr:type II toxin-antitoxin system HicB family antitoxin [Halomonas caseinilytica]
MTSVVLGYLDYAALIEFDAEDELFVGRVLGITDRISFHGESVAELTEAFHAAVNHYLEDCRATGREPLKPASGRMMLRIPPKCMPPPT